MDEDLERKHTWFTKEYWRRFLLSVMSMSIVMTPVLIYDAKKVEESDWEVLNNRITHGMEVGRSSELLKIMLKRYGFVVDAGEKLSAGETLFQAKREYFWMSFPARKSAVIEFQTSQDKITSVAAFLIDK